MTVKLKVGLLWHSDSNGNLGVGALTIGNMALARRAADRAGVDLEFHLFKPTDPTPSYIREGIASRHDINGRYTFSPAGFRKTVKGLDLMLDIAGGDSFTDIYHNRRYVYQVATKLITIGAGVPLVLSPQTIGPFSRQPHTAAARRILERSRAVFARDPMSMAAVAEIAPGADAHRTVDVAFALPFERMARGPGIRVGIGISAMLYFGSSHGAKEFGLQVDYRDYTHRLIEALLARGDVTVELIKHVYAPDIPFEHDPAAAKALQALYPQLVDGPDFASPSDAKSHISGLDFLVAARMHATIAAYSAGVPVVPLSYSRKFEGLFGGLDYRWLVPVTGMTTDEALAFTLQAFERRADLAVDIAEGNERIARLLEAYVAPLSQILSEIAARRTGGQR